MFKIIKNNPKAFAIAVVLHIVLMLMLSLSLDWTSTHKVSTPKVDVVQAVMVDEGKVQAEMKKLEMAEKKKRDKEDARQRKLEEKAEEAERKRKQEEKNISELQKKKEKEKRLLAEEAKRKKAEEKKVEELSKKRKVEEKRLAELEQKRKQEAELQRKLEAEKKRKAEEDKRRKEAEEALKAEIAAEQARLQEIRQGELNSEKDRYLAQIKQRIENKWLKPSDWKPGIKCNVLVRLVPGKGTAQVIDARITRSCGQPLFDRSVETAVFNASPLPIPTSPELINEFREINFIFDPKD